MTEMTDSDMSEILNYLPWPPSKKSAVKCFSQGRNRLARVGFEPKPCQSQSRRLNYLTTLPTMCSSILENKGRKMLFGLGFWLFCLDLTSCCLSLSTV